MTTTTNGKRKNHKSDLHQPASPITLAQSTEELEQILANDNSTMNDVSQPSNEATDQIEDAAQPDSLSELSQELPNSAQTPLSAEELLRQAKQQSKKDLKEDEEEQVEGSGTQDTAIAPQTATSEISAALTQAALNLVEANKEAKQKRIETGIFEGLEDAKDIRIGKQLGTILSLTEADKVDAVELAEQLQNLRAHTDAETADVVTEALKGLGIDLNAIREGKQDPTETGKKKAPLGSTLSSNLPSKGSSFKIL